MQAPAIHLSRSTFPSAAALQRDLVAGLVVGVIALPLAIALSVAVGAPPIAGLYTATFAGATASIAGGSRYNITGPTAALVPVLSQAVLTHGVASLPLIAAMAGVMLLVMSHFRLGRLMRYMPGLVVVGFTAGIALSIAFGQLNNLLAVTGTDPHLEHFHEKTWDTFIHLGTVGLATPLMALGSLALLLSWPHIPAIRRVPGPLIAVILFAALTQIFGIDTPTLAGRYGELPSGFPKPTLGWLDAGLAFDVLPSAVAVAILGGVESLLSATVADGMASTDIRHEPDRELRGQGLANLVSPIFGGIPATAAIARTAAGIKNGGNSRIVGVTHAVVVLIATLALGGLAGKIPLVTLAAILCVVAWNIAEAPELARLFRRAPRADLLVLISTILVTLFFDLTYAIGLGVLLSLVLLIRQLAQLPAARALLPGADGRISPVSPGLSDLIQSRPDIAFFTASESLSFLSAATFEYELGADAGRPLILRMKDVRYVDTTGLLTLEGIIEHRQKHGGRVILTAIQPDVRATLQRFGILDLLGPGNVFDHTRDAIADIKP